MRQAPDEPHRLHQLRAHGEVVDAVAHLRARHRGGRRRDAHDGVRAIDPVPEVPERPARPKLLHSVAELVEHHRHGHEPLRGRDPRLVELHGDVLRIDQGERLERFWGVRADRRAEVLLLARGNLQNAARVAVLRAEHLEQVARAEAADVGRIPQSRRRRCRRRPPRRRFFCTAPRSSLGSRS